jgi:hypothetical protein
MCIDIAFFRNDYTHEFSIFYNPFILEGGLWYGDVDGIGGIGAWIHR